LIDSGIKGSTLCFGEEVKPNGLIEIRHMTDDMPIAWV